MTAKEHCLSAVIAESVSLQARNVTTFVIVRANASLEILPRKTEFILNKQPFLQSLISLSLSQGVTLLHDICTASERIRG